MNSYKPCLFFETSAPARVGHYLETTTTMVIITIIVIIAILLVRIITRIILVIIAIRIAIRMEIIWSDSLAVLSQ